MHKYGSTHYKPCEREMKISYEKELDKIKKIVKESPRGITTKDIAKKIGINRNVVGKYLDVLQVKGEVDVEKFGRSKVYFSSKSVPVSAMFDYAKEFIIVVTKDMKAIDVNTPFVKYLGLKKGLNECSFSLDIVTILPPR